MSGLCAFWSCPLFLSYSFLLNWRLEIIGSVKFGRFPILPWSLFHLSPVSLCCLIWPSKKKGSFPPPSPLLCVFVHCLRIIFCLLTREVTCTLAVLTLTCWGYALAWHAMFGQHYPVGGDFQRPLTLPHLSKCRTHVIDPSGKGWTMRMWGGHCEIAVRNASVLETFGGLIKVQVHYAVDFIDFSLFVCFLLFCIPQAVCLSSRMF